MRTIIAAAIATVLIVWAAWVLALHYFGAVHREQNVREKHLDRRQARLEAWSDELEKLDAAGVARARAIAVHYDRLDRALGPAPLQVEEADI